MNKPTPTIFTDKYDCPIFLHTKLINATHTIYVVINDFDLGICIENTKTHTIEMLTEEIAEQLEVLPQGRNVFSSPLIEQYIR